MKNIIKLLSFLIIINSAFAKNYIEEHLKTFNWNGLDIVWLEDSSLPTYDVLIYFQDGAISEKKGSYGSTEMMFEQLSAGTNKFSHHKIVEELEFYGVRFGSHVTHEYSTFKVSGLVKDIGPSFKMICHMFKEANYPDKEIEKVKNRAVNGLESLPTNHSKLANHIFRKVSLNESGVDSATTGTINSIKNMKSSMLKERLQYFNQNVPKRIYLKGSKDVLALKKIIKSNCGWKQAGISKNKSYSVVDSKVDKALYFVPVKNANQAQVRVGRMMTEQDLKKIPLEHMSFASKFLGGGFTSELVQELRVNKGLTYSAGAYASAQKTYGRSGISTFTRNEKILEMLSSINEVIERNSKQISEKKMTMAKRSMKGNYLLGLESSSDFLENLLLFDHIGKDYNDIYKFTSVIDKTTPSDLALTIKEIFAPEKQVYFVLGDKSLIPILKKAGYKINILDYKDFL